ncbi:alanine racemase [Mycolicibacterium aichiense]|uniref:Amino acid deaminase n=1 Tax=Mycolicibacterium aichiense TaxID=1799 RepID=A0AAD1HJ43_9MYCO|nr:alanine racemase [Mycolicibacterium aichiense]MCV7021103.1 alanine racemase [Mycolicibacterium aichiense]BBX05679.1 amino acid deaminase [Mycolicibacterium aichiense]STZ24978.1 putative amino acid aldolase or racemase [Mycolicibacterium aichiense]
MGSLLNAAAVTALAGERVDWRFKGLPASWSGLTVAQICAAAPDLLDAGPLGPVCVLSDTALRHNLATMAQWCARHGVELAPHGKTHMSPQLLARQFAAGGCAVTAATISQVRTYRAFGVREVVLANELVDAAGLTWLAAELDTDPEFRLICWVDSARGVALMTEALHAAGARRRLDVCVELGALGTRTGCRDDTTADAVAAAVVASPRLRLVGVAGYEAALGHDVSPAGVERVRGYLEWVRAVAIRLAPLCSDMVVTAGGSTHFDLVAETLTGPWRTVLRSGVYLTNDDGLYLRTSPLTRPGAEPGGFVPAMHVWAQVCSRPEPGLALLTMGRRDVSFDADLPVPQRLRVGSDWTDLAGCEVTALNDQHAFVRLSPAAEDAVQVGSWIEFGVSHPCTVFDKWQLIPVLDAGGRVVDLVRTFF